MVAGELRVTLSSGIGNRVNGLINGIVLANHLRRPVHFHWPVGDHCGACFVDIFDSPHSGWLKQAIDTDVKLTEGTFEPGLFMPHALFCPPLSDPVRRMRELFRNMPLEDYDNEYRKAWDSIRWSHGVLDRLIPEWNGTAFHARTNRLDGTYVPPLPEELELIGSAAYICTDSDHWKKRFLEMIPESFAVETWSGSGDLDGRGANAIVAAAAELVMLTKASKLFIHAPVESSFSSPAVYAAKVPTWRIAYRSHSW